MKVKWKKRILQKILNILQKVLNKEGLTAIKSKNLAYRLER